MVPGPEIIIYEYLESIFELIEAEGLPQTKDDLWLMAEDILEYLSEHYDFVERDPNEPQ